VAAEWNLDEFEDLLKELLDAKTKEM